MAHRWYFGRDNQLFGPYSGAELKGFVLTGQLRPQDTVWQDGIEKGSLASRVKYLFAGAVAPVSPVAVLEPSPAAAAAVSVTEPPPAPPPPAEPTPFPDDADLLPMWEPPPPVPEKAAPAPEQPRKRRVLSMKGGRVVSQDGFTVRYRKACAVCFHEDNSIASAAIRSGMTRVHYFCPKCKKSRPVEIQAVG
jgi:hypothetical protein